VNIFVLDEDPILAAQYQCDKHIVKMPTETAQMLSTAIAYLGIEDNNLYKSGFKNHPCSIWTRMTKKNFIWLCDHGLALCEEYTKRYNKIHKAQNIIELAKLYNCKFTGDNLTNFAQAMPEECKNEDSVIAYRTYYICYKASFAKWKTEKPWWWFTYEDIKDL